MTNIQRQVKHILVVYVGYKTKMETLFSTKEIRSHLEDQALESGEINIWYISYLEKDFLLKCVQSITGINTKT